MFQFVHSLFHRKIDWILSLAAVGLIVASFIVPPTGMIDPSVLAAVGEIFAFTALLSVSSHLSNGKEAKIKHNNTEITIGDELDNE